ncbi:ABC transporter ATP-binding protein [Streptomyces sp. A 4/2]|uniref:ABC transporter ATP-binding protein n=1 Tax=Streptomyces sp. A 4/2 TaxID=2934314 RepID=UPI0020257CB9|nr:ABC transporter ATP-binding protein [Streptomyces sp. A 4/2]
MTSMSRTSDTSDEPALLAAVDVSKHFTVRDQLGRKATVHAVEHASVALHRGRVVALVGESGSGKTTLARMLAQFHPVSSGEIRLAGQPAPPAGRDYFRQVQLIFQDPFSSLNTLHPVRHILGRVLRLHGHARTRAEADEQVLALLNRVNLTPAEEFIDKRPREMSGGQLQRVAIARALAVRPTVLLGDEPISMLDVSIRLDVLNLLARLRDEEGLALLYITHDIAGARYLCDEVQVMYAGQTVEGGPKEAVIQSPKHPYTRLLIDSSPDPGRTGRGLGDQDDAEDLGEPPNLTAPPGGCRFHPRCPFVMDDCRRAFPDRTTFADGQWAHCWLHQHGRTAELDRTPAKELP